MKRTCYNFEPSGHRFHPLDGLTDGTSEFICRLYCTRCGRISIASVENNVANWNQAALPIESQNDFMTNAPNIIRKADA